MPDMSEIEVMLSTSPILISFVIRPEEIELALATNGETLRHRLLLAIVAELTSIEAAAVQ